MPPPPPQWPLHRRERDFTGAGARAGKSPFRSPGGSNRIWRRSWGGRPGGAGFPLTLCDFQGLRILPGRETAEPTWPRAVLWLTAARNSPTTTGLGVGRRELDSGSGTDSPSPFLPPGPEMPGSLWGRPVGICFHFPSPRPSVVLFWLPGASSQVRVVRRGPRPPAPASIALFREGWGGVERSLCSDTNTE